MRFSIFSAPLGSPPEESPAPVVERGQTSNFEKRQRLQKHLIKKIDKYTLVSYGHIEILIISVLWTRFWDIMGYREYSRMRGEQQTWRMAHFSAVLAQISWVSSECASQPRAIKQGTAPTFHETTNFLAKRNVSNTHIVELWSVIWF